MSEQVQTIIQETTAPEASIKGAQGAKEEQAPVEQAQTPEPKAAEDARKPASAAFSTLAKKERMLVQQQQKLMAEKAELEKLRQDIEAYKGVKSKAKMDPIKFLEESGLSYEELTQFVINGGKPGPDAYVSEVKSELEKFKEEVAGKEAARLQAEKEALEAQNAQIIADFKDSVMGFLSDNKEKYELIDLYNAQDLVFSTIEQHFETTQKIMTKEEAAQLTEEYLEKEVIKASQTKKLQSKLAPTPAPQEQKGFSTQQTKTLSNDLISSAVPSTLSPKTESDRLKRALAALT